MLIPRNFSLEVYLYDTQKLAKETDDPRSAILFHFPHERSDRHVLLQAGHMAGLYLSARAFLDCQDNETGVFRTSDGFCQVIPLAKGRFLCIFVCKIIKPASLNHQHREEQCLFMKKDDQCSVAELKRAEEFMQDVFLKSFEGSFKLLFNDEKRPCQRLDDIFIDDVTHLEDFFNSFCDAFARRIKQTIKCTVHNATVSKIFFQIESTLKNLRPVFMWAFSKNSGKLQKCSSSFFNAEETEWLTFLQTWRSSRPCCSRGGRSKVNRKTGTILWPLKTITKELLQTHEKCIHEEHALSIADMLRGNIFSTKAEEQESWCFVSRSGQCDCFTLYIQSGNESSIGIIFQTCINQMTQDVLDSLWTACLARLTSVTKALSDENDSSSISSKRRRPRIR